MTEEYDAGLLNDYGGGDVDWWHDYMRSEIGRANDFHAEIHSNNEIRIKELEDALRQFVSGPQWAQTKASLASNGRQDLAKALSEKNVLADTVIYHNPW